MKFYTFKAEDLGQVDELLRVLPRGSYARVARDLTMPFPNAVACIETSLTIYELFEKIEELPENSLISETLVPVFWQFGELEGDAVSEPGRWESGMLRQHLDQYQTTLQEVADSTGINSGLLQCYVHGYAEPSLARRAQMVLFFQKKAGYYPNKNNSKSLISQASPGQDFWGRALELD